MMMPLVTTPPPPSMSITVAQIRHVNFPWFADFIFVSSLSLQILLLYLENPICIPRQLPPHLVHCYLCNLDLPDYGGSFCFYRFWNRKMIAYDFIAFTLKLTVPYKLKTTNDLGLLHRCCVHRDLRN